MSESKNKRIIDITINIDTEKKFFKVVDYDSKSSCGAISGGYKNKEHFLDMFNDYFEKYICLDSYESDDEE